MWSPFQKRSPGDPVSKDGQGGTGVHPEAVRGGLRPQQSVHGQWSGSGAQRPPRTASAALAQGAAGFPVPGEEKEAGERGGVLVDSVDMFVSPLGQGEWEGDFSLEVLTAVP